jgi:murein DD-endopeptidase MepM/ murein hydrolase activator NlpD
MNNIVYRSLILLLAITSVVISPSTVTALIYGSPPPLTNREKAHRNILFTGGGNDPATSEACSTGDTQIGSISKDFTLGAEAKQRRINFIKAFMAAYGLTAEQAAGPLGNFMRESAGTATEAVKIPPDVNQNEVYGAPPNNTLLGYSWAQWSGGRKTAFVQHMNDQKYVTASGRATDAAALSYLMKELDSPSYASVIPELKKQKTPEDAALSFESTFERAGSKAYGERTKFARQAFEEYKEAGGGTLSGCGTSSSANFGQVAFPLKGTKKVVLNPAIFNNGDTEKGGHPYTAYDIYAKEGTEVVAFAAGTVTYTSADRCGGKFLTIWNKQAQLGVTYMHLSEHLSNGQKVNPGDHVGTVGSAAAGCGTEHLHIDASTDKVRQACSREGCSIQDHFRPIGKELFTTYQSLADN